MSGNGSDDRLRVLVVDDEPDILEVLSRMLSTLDCDVVTAASAEEAATAFVKGSFDLVTLDHRMPGLKGTDLHMILSQEFGSGRRTTGFAVRRLPPVLVITALAGDPEVQGLRSGEGILGVLQKPVRVDDLRAVLSRLQADADAGRDPGTA